MRNPMDEPETQPVSLRRRLPVEWFIAGVQVDAETWRQVCDDLDDAGHDDHAYAVPGDPATGKPVRWHIVPPPGVTVQVPLSTEDTGRQP